MDIINSRITEYTKSFTSPESDLIKRLVTESEEKLEFINMLSGRQIGILLRLLVQISGAKRILEIGTFTGYSAMMMAEVLPDGGELITVEMNEHYKIVSDKYFLEPPFKNKIYQIMGNAREIISRIEGEFGLVFLDADKINYPEYYKQCKQKLKPGGIFVADNVLWGGEVLDPTDEKSIAIHKMNEMIRDDEDVEQIMLPLRDGVTIARKR